MRRPRLGLWLLAALGGGPIAFSLGYILLYSLGLTGLLERGFTLAHWRAVLGAAELWRSLAYSLWIASAVVGLGGAAGLALALGLGERLERGPLAACLPLPLALPGTVVALLVFMGLGGSGWLPRLLLTAGLLPALGDRFSLVQDPWSAGILAAHCFLATPFLALSFRALYRGERLAELAAAAAALGASPRQRLWRVVLPVLLRRAAPTLGLVFITVLGSYEIPLLLGRQSPQMLSVLVQRKYQRFDLQEKPEALVVALLYSLLVFAALAWLLRRRGPLEDLSA